MSNPNDPFPPQPDYGAPPQPPYGGPPQPPYGAPPPGNSKLLIGIIAGLALVIVVGATLYFTGAFGGGRSSRAEVTGTPVPLTAQNLAGVWSQEGSCDFVVDYKANGDYYRAGTDTGYMNTRGGTWRLEGNRILHKPSLAANGVVSENTAEDPAAEIISLTTESQVAKVYQGGGEWEDVIRIRCPFPPATGGAGPTGTSSASPQPAPQGQMSERDLQAYLQAQSTQMQGQLPRQAGPIVIQMVRAEGFVMSIRATAPTNDWASIRSQLGPAICSGPAGVAVRSGARISIDMLHEASGSTDRMTVSSC